MRQVQMTTALVGLVAGIMTTQQVCADVYYEVGPSQTYATIQAAVNATPWNPGVGTVQPVFTENHIINVHAGTYVEFVYGDQFSHLNGQLSRTSKDKRLIFQANPGDEVVWQAASTYALQLRESHVTVQGFKFTGLSPNPNGYYINISTGGYSVPNTQRGGFIIYDNEFVGARPLRQGAAQADIEPGVDFAHAIVNNFIHDFETHYEVAGPSTLPKLVAGNLYARWGTAGGSSIFLPLTVSHDPAHQARWYLNNTLYTEGGNMAGALRADVADSSNVTFANNIVIKTVSTGLHSGYLIRAGGGSYPSYGLTAMPTMDSNLMSGGGLTWGVIFHAFHPADPAGLNGTWNWALSAIPAAETNAVYGDPLFIDAGSDDFRLLAASPATGTGDAAALPAVIASLGIGSQLAAYSNTARNIGYQPLTNPENRGALSAECETCADFLAPILDVLCTIPSSVSLAEFKANVETLIGNTVIGPICDDAQPGGGSEAACEAYMAEQILSEAACNAVKALLD